jgi:hypothetical protein
VSSRCSIPIPDRPAHSLVRYPDLIEFRALCPETQPLVESAGVRLRVQVHLGESALSGEVHEAAHDREAGPGATVLRQYGDTTNLTGRFQPASANQVTFCRRGDSIRHNVRDDGVEVVPFLVLGNVLFLYENSPADAFDRRAIVPPGRDFQDEILPQRRRHFRDASPVM